MDSQQSAKTIADRRKSPRIQTENDVGYILFDDNREVTDQGSAKALDLSQNGILLETERPLNGSCIMLITLDLNGKKVKVKGRVANTRKSDTPGCHLTGIEFKGSEEQHKKAVVAFVKVYHNRRQRDQNKSLYSFRQPVS
ncbi:MAG: PilZ domain-containing protein [Desulfobacteraceae bacterium]|nr:PilZ domain-containing protein [Desulfobacteraceae bacterium]